MEEFAPLIFALVTMPLFAAIGYTTVAAFGLMGILGLVTEWSFKRIFFTAFLLGLAAPILVGISLATMTEQAMDGRDLRQVIEQNIPGSGERLLQWEEAGARMEEVGEAAERGDITEQEARVQIEQIVREQTGVQLDLEGVTIDAEDGSIRIETNSDDYADSGAEASADADTDADSNP